MIQKILFDTNFLMLPFQQKIDIFSELERICDFQFEIFVLDNSIDELKSLVEKRKGAEKDHAKLALSLLDTINVKILKSGQKGHTDDIILSMDDFIVATRDMPLVSRLRKKGRKVITVRQKNHLIFV